MSNNITHAHLMIQPGNIVEHENGTNIVLVTRGAYLYHGMWCFKGIDVKMNGQNKREEAVYVLDRFIKCKNAQVEINLN